MDTGTLDLKKSRHCLVLLLKNHANPKFDLSIRDFVLILYCLFPSLRLDLFFVWLTFFVSLVLLIPIRSGGSTS